MNICNTQRDHVLPSESVTIESVAGVLGQGGFGKVYVGRVKGIENQVAIKMVSTISTF